MDNTLFPRWRYAIRAWWFSTLGKDSLASAEYAASFQHCADPVAARHLGCLLEKQGEMDAAADWFEKALKLDPEHADTCFNLGFVLGKANRPREALQAFKAATQLNPVLDRAWFGMGIAHTALAEHTEAVAMFEEAARLQPMNSEARYHLGTACFQSGDMQRTRATIKELRRFDAPLANKLIQATSNTEFSDLVTELPF